MDQPGCQFVVHLVPQAWCVVCVQLHADVIFEGDVDGCACMVPHEIRSIICDCISKEEVQNRLQRI